MEKEFKPFLAIDPGLNFGWAYWGEDMLVPSRVGLERTKGKGDNWEERSLMAANKLHNLLIDSWLDEDTLDRVVCEWPDFVGVTSKGGVGKLHCLIGMFARTVDARGIPFQRIPVREWKGQLPKEVVNKRIEQRLGKPFCKQLKADMWDAVGIGLHYLGEF